MVGIRKLNTKIKHNMLSAVFAIAFIATVFLVNVIVGIISECFNTTGDLTGEGLYTLDEKTEDYLTNSLKSDVEITVLSTRKEYEEKDQSYKQVSEILDKMEKMSPHITTNFLDINQNPNYTSKFKGETLSADSIVIESEKTGRHKILTPYDYFNFNQEYMQYYNVGVVESSNIEQAAVSGIMYVSDEKLVKAAFTEGCGESGGDALKNLLSNNGYEVSTVDLTTADSIDADIVVIYAPTIDLDPKQLAKLDAFLENNGSYGKNVFYFASTAQPKTPNIDSFLSDWGLEVGYSVIGQTDDNYLMSSETLYAHLQEVCSDTDYTESSGVSTLRALGADLRPVFETGRGSADTTPLMKTYDNAFLFPLDLDDNEKFDYDSAERGIFNDVVIAERSNNDGVFSRVTAVGSDQLSGAILMSYTNAVNSYFFAELFAGVSGKEQSIVINAKQFSNVTFEMNASTAKALTVALCVVIPVCVIVLGIVIWVRRRHK